jgi:LPXTG-motif cell wall-anchored protein
VTAPVAKKVTKKKVVKKKTAKKKTKTVAQPTKTLAYTGLDAALPIGALVLLGGGLVVARRRRRAQHPTD